MGSFSLRSEIESFGVWNTLNDLFHRTLNKAFLYKKLRCIRIAVEDVSPEFLEAHPKYEMRFLLGDELRDYARSAEHDFGVAFVAKALAKGDECYGILDKGHLASYGWYSQKPTQISSDLTLNFDPSFVYMYKGYTHPDYRGQRLHAFGMAHALREYTRRGCKGMVSYVESTNFQSLRSCYRMGYKDFGDVFILGLRGKYLTHASKGCQMLGFFISIVSASQG
jgi:GNAT superfamily N-acetyltransferase